MKRVFAITMLVLMLLSVLVGYGWSISDQFGGTWLFGCLLATGLFVFVILLGALVVKLLEWAIIGG